MNYCSQVCQKEEHAGTLNPKYFCKAWQGEGQILSGCPKSGDFKPEDCEFAVIPTLRKIPWLHGETVSEEKPIKVEEQKKTIVTKVAKNAKSKVKSNR